MPKIHNQHETVLKAEYLKNLFFLLLFCLGGGGGGGEAEGGEESGTLVGNFSPRLIHSWWSA